MPSRAFSGSRIVCGRILSAPSTSSRFTFFVPSTFTFRHSGRSWTRTAAAGLVAVVAGGLHAAADLVEDAHRVDRADVAVDRRLVERLPRLRPEVHADRVLLHADVPRDADARDRRLALRAQQADARQ